MFVHLRGPQLPANALTCCCGSRSFRALSQTGAEGNRGFMELKMKVRNSLKSLRGRHQKNQVVRRRGRLYVINKVNKRFKARQG